MKSFIKHPDSHRIITIVISLFALFSCDYLDVIPDNIPTIDMSFADRNAAEKYLFTCYSYLPGYMHIDSDPAVQGSDEIYIFDAAGISRTNLGLINGSQNVANPICNYWNGTEWGLPMYTAIRDCNTFLEKINMPTDIREAERERWIAEVKFLKAYYHFILFRSYGAISIVDENLPISAEAEKMMLYRIPVDSCVNYISGLLTEAAEALPMKVEKEATELGRVTKPIALAVKAKLLATAASPLFNGNPDYNEIIDNRGTQLFNPAFDAEKWEKAAEACKEAIEIATQAGFGLYQEVNAPHVLNDTLQLELTLRSIIYDKWNKEMIWGSTKTDTRWIQTQVMPRLEGDWALSSTLNGVVSPTFDLVERYYSENGVPINEDNSFDYPNRHKTRRALYEEKWYIKEGEETALLHFNREPRFYAAIGFDRGIWWGNGRTSLTEELYSVQVRANEAAGLRSWEHLSMTGYFAKKLMDYETVVDKDNFTAKTTVFPMIRIADLYLLYSEILNEIKGTPDEEVYYYIDQVRKRAGLEDCRTAWRKWSTIPDKPATQAGMREIIRHERLIELALEGHSFWDIRRWKEAVSRWNKPAQGWNIHGEDAQDFYNPVVIEKRMFSTRDYLWPFKEYDLIANKNLRQNYGW